MYPIFYQYVSKNSRKLLSKFIICALLFMQFSCGFSTEKRRPPALEKRLEERSIKILSEAEILQKVQQLGDSITNGAEKQLLAAINNEMAREEYDAALTLYTNRSQLANAMADSFKVSLKRTSLNTATALNQPNELERGLLEAYQYSFDEKIALDNNVQFYNNKDSILYNKPIFLSESICLKCHGNSETVPPEMETLLSVKFPKFKKENHELNDLLGMWSVGFSKRQLVNSF